MEDIQWYIQCVNFLYFSIHRNIDFRGKASGAVTPSMTVVLPFSNKKARLRKVSGLLADTKGFEPSTELLTLYTLSREAH